MQLVVLRETQPEERRVALTPESVKKLIQAGAQVAVEPGAGEEASIADADYQAAGASLGARADLLASADVLVAVNCPANLDLERLRSGAVLLGFLRPLDEPGGLVVAAERNLTTFAVELIPRTTRAQAMDALSSMATVVGYKAVIMGADRLPKMFPLLMTAAGTIPPARVLVIGAGVAGLQAIATARRLGAVVEAYDVRRAAGEDVKSLGAKFLEVDLGGIQTQDAGGYAVELSEEALKRGRDLVAEHARTADLVITTAQVPGRRAPLMLTKEAVEGMRPGSIIVDLAGATGGNCALTRPGENLVVGGVEIIAPLNLAASLPVHASQLYSRNLTAFLKLLIREGALDLNFDDDIVAGACVTHAGQFVNQRVAGLVSKMASAS